MPGDEAVASATAPERTAYVLEPGGVALPEPLNACTNCNASLHGPYCARCGERQPEDHDYTLAGLLHEGAHAFLHLDGTFWRTIRSLVRKPGELTLAYFEGRKSRFMRPLAVFILSNLLFFTIQPMTGIFGWKYDTYARPTLPNGAPRPSAQQLEAKRLRTAESVEVFRLRFDAALAANKKSMLLFQIPIFALAVGLVQRRKRRPLAEHVVFGIHTYAVFLLALVSYIVIFFTIVGLERLARPLWGPLPGLVRFADSEGGIVAILGAAVGAWLWVAIRRVYGDRPVAATVKAVVLLSVLSGLIPLSFAPLFYVTLWLL